MKKYLPNMNVSGEELEKEYNKAWEYSHVNDLTGRYPFTKLPAFVKRLRHLEFRVREMRLSNP